MDRKEVISIISNFPPHGRDTVLVDKIMVSFSVRRNRAKPQRKMESLSSTRDIGLPYDEELRFRKSKRGDLITWNKGDILYELLIPKKKQNGLYSIPLKVVFNPLRILRKRLSRRERALHFAPADAKENMLHPRAVSPEEAHKRVVNLVCQIARRVRREFVGILDVFYGFQIKKSEVSVTASQIELAWDRQCDPSATAIHAFAPAWLATIPQSRKMYLIGEEDDDSRIELWGDGVLKARLRKGWNLKLYALPDGVIRYECQLIAKTVRAVVTSRAQ